MKALARKLVLALAMVTGSLPAMSQSAYQPELLGRTVTPIGTPNWVPVVLLPVEQLRPYPLGAAEQLAADGVLLGFLNINEVEAPLAAGNMRRVQVAGQIPVFDRLQLRGMLAASEFKPCVGLLDQPELAPLRPDLCGSFGPGKRVAETSVAGLGAQLELSQGWIGVSVQHAEGEDLSFALPNISTPLATAQPVPIMLGVETVSGFGLSPMLAPFSSDSVNLQAVLELDSESQIGLGMALARAQIEVSSQSAPVLMDQGTLSFSLQQGNLSAHLGTRVINFPDVQGFLPWAGLDLGLSWRLPWQGVISVGAQNLITRGKPPRLLNPAVEDTTESFSRVPYVRYHQDL